MFSLGAIVWNSSVLNWPGKFIVREEDKGWYS